MPLKDSRVTSLAAALAEPHPLVVFEPNELDVVNDPTLLHDRISDYFSSAGAVLKESLDAFEHLNKLAQRCERDEWAEAKIKQYQSQVKHSSAQPKDPKIVFKDSLANPLPIVTDAEVDAFIAALTSTQLRTLNRMQTLEKLDGFDYMWDLEEIHDASTRDEKATINAHSTQAVSVAPPPAIQKPALRKTDDGTLSGAAVTSDDPRLPDFTTKDSSAFEYLTNTNSLNTTLGEPACTVEVAYAAGANAMTSVSDDESTGSFGQFSRMALARAEKQGLFRGDGKASDHSNAAVTAAMSPKEPYAVPDSVGNPLRDDLGPLQNTETPYHTPSSAELLPSDAAAGAESAVKPSAQNGRISSGPGPTTVRSSQTASSDCDGCAPGPAVAGEQRDPSDAVPLRDYVRRLLLVSRVRERDELGLRRVVYAEAQAELAAVTARCAPAMEQLLVLLKEAHAILPGLGGLERSVLRDRVDDPASFLCVPRHTLRCAAVDCGSAFSTTVLRVRCGRCGQVYCPQCCRERGLGPAVRCGSQRLSLGWEPICGACWRVCCHRRDRHGPGTATLTVMPAPPGSGDRGGGLVLQSTPGREGAAAASTGTCGDDAGERLEDGLAVFRVMDGTEIQVGLGDSWMYRIAKMQGSLQCLWQSTGILAGKLIRNAAHQLNGRHRYRIQEMMRPASQKSTDAAPISLNTEERAESDD